MNLNPGIPFYNGLLYCFLQDVIRQYKWPKPCPPGTSKEEIFIPAEYKEWEQRALTVKSYGIPNDFDTLCRYLCEGAATDLQKVRAIYIWVTSQDCHSVDSSVQIDLNSPLGYLAALKQECATYANLFAKICMSVFHSHIYKFSQKIAKNVKIE